MAIALFHKLYSSTAKSDTTLSADGLTTSCVGMGCSYVTINTEPISKTIPTILELKIKAMTIASNRTNYGVTFTLTTTADDNNAKDFIVIIYENYSSNDLLYTYKEDIINNSTTVSNLVSKQFPKTAVVVGDTLALGVDPIKNKLDIFVNGKYIQSADLSLISQNLKDNQVYPNLYLGYETVYCSFTIENHFYPEQYTYDYRKFYPNWPALNLKQY